MTKPLTFGVIGHVDHGKSALVHALTGMDPDRLKEEKQRGMSIVLGFSYLQSPHATIDLIDVPGHENFIRTMISGATGFDGVMLVVAANEGVMPQTREHLEIARLLGVKQGLIVITKQDLVSATELATVSATVRSFVADTFLENAELVCTAATRDQSMEKIRAAFAQLAGSTHHTPRSGQPFLPIDRAFIMRGFGPVVTGTLRGGELETNARVELLPRRLPATIRGLQVHGQAVTRAVPGQRVAINLRNISRDNIRRGDIVALTGQITLTRRIDVELTLLKNSSQPLKNGALIRVLNGTAENMARVRMLNCKRLEPGATELAQLRFEQDIAVLPNERFIIRSYSPVVTIGGGIVLDVHAHRHKRFDASVTHHLDTIARGDITEKCRTLLAEAGVAGVTRELFTTRLDLTSDEIGKVMTALQAEDVGADTYLENAVYTHLHQATAANIASYHQEQPFHLGIAMADLRKRLPADLTNTVFQHVIRRLLLEELIDTRQNMVWLQSFDPLASLPEKHRRIATDMEQTWRNSGLTTPDIQQIVGNDKDKQVLFELLCKTRRLVRLKTLDRKSARALHTTTIDHVLKQLNAEFSGARKFAVADVRDLLGTTRKYLLPLLEHLDATGVTLRQGNWRQLRIQESTKPGGE